MRAEQLNAVANAIAASDTIDPNGELSMRVRCAMRDIDRAARALDAADTALDDCALVLMRGSASKAETLKVMQKVQAALAEIRGEK